MNTYGGYILATLNGMVHVLPVIIRAVDDMSAWNSVRGLAIAKFPYESGFRGQTGTVMRDETNATSPIIAEIDQIGARY